LKVRLERLRKVYPGSGGRPKVAVKDLTFGIRRGETFGFLGINGAGKTTTLSILSGDFPPSAGTAFIVGCNIETQQGQIRRQIGCVMNPGPINRTIRASDPTCLDASDMMTALDRLEGR
jgi:ABC-type multidrug transport system ATPase subunit